MCVQAHIVSVLINMQVWQWDGLWTQLTVSWQEGRGESAVDGLKRSNGLSVTHSTFPPMVCWSGHWCFPGQAQIQTDTPAQCCSDSLFQTARDRVTWVKTCRQELCSKLFHRVTAQTLFYSHPLADRDAQ